MTQHLYFVTGNANKFRELQDGLAACPVHAERVALDLPEIQALDPAEVASFKARAGFEALTAQGITNPLVLVEDTGLGINAWDGFPGALIKWVLGTVGEAGLCRQLNAWEDRSALATVVLCLYDGQTVQRFTGQTTGTITHEPRGTLGFGWDSIFQPDGYTITYGEMPREEKMKISMRGLALTGLKKYFQVQ